MKYTKYNENDIELEYVHSIYRKNISEYVLEVADGIYVINFDNNGNYVSTYSVKSKSEECIYEEKEYVSIDNDGFLEFSLFDNEELNDMGVDDVTVIEKIEEIERIMMITNLMNMN